MNWTFWTRKEPLASDDCDTLDPLLSLFADGMASAEEAQRVEAHLPGCAACRESLAWLRATRHALASRPVVLPPADLRARIASAIAASDSAPAPVTFSTRRAFALRPALAAAASLAMLGVVSYGLLHHPPSPAVQPVTPQVAVAPPADTTAPAIKTVPGPGFKQHLTRHPAPAARHTRPDPALVARNQPDEAVPAPVVVKTHPQAKPEKMLADAAPAPAVMKTHPVVVKRLILRTSPPAMMATTKAPAFSAAPHKLPVIKPETKVAPLIAEVPHAAAPTFIEKQPIITQDPAPTVAVASSQEGHFQTAEANGVIKLRFPIETFKHAIIARADRGATIATTMIDQNRTPGFDITRGPFDK